MKMGGEPQNIHWERVSVLANVASTQELCIKLDAVTEQLIKLAFHFHSREGRKGTWNILEKWVYVNVMLKGSKYTLGSWMITFSIFFNV